MCRAHDLFCQGNPLKMTALRPLIVCCATLLLAACGKPADQPAAKAAGGQVLPGTISDAMLNLDQSKSQPLLQPAPVVHGPANADASDAAAEPAADAAAPAPAPAN
jgi:hypothetical protein